MTKVVFSDVPEGDLKERVCGFILLVEHREYVAVFKSNLDVPSDFKTEYFGRTADSRVEAAVPMGVVVDSSASDGMSLTCLS